MVPAPPRSDDAEEDAQPTAAKRMQAAAATADSRRVPEWEWEAPQGYLVPVLEEPKAYVAPTAAGPTGVVGEEELEEKELGVQGYLVPVLKEPKAYVAPTAAGPTGMVGEEELEEKELGVDELVEEDPEGTSPRWQRAFRVCKKQWTGFPERLPAQGVLTIFSMTAILTDCRQYLHACPTVKAVRAVSGADRATKGQVYCQGPAAEQKRQLNDQATRWIARYRELIELANLHFVGNYQKAGVVGREDDALLRKRYALLVPKKHRSPCRQMIHLVDYLLHTGERPEVGRQVRTGDQGLSGPSE